MTSKRGRDGLTPFQRNKKITAIKQEAHVYGLAALSDPLLTAQERREDALIVLTAAAHRVARVGAGG